MASASTPSDIYAGLTWAGAWTSSTQDVTSGKTGHPRLDGVQSREDNEAMRTLALSAPETMCGTPIAGA